MAIFVKIDRLLFLSEQPNEPAARIEWTPDGPGLHVLRTDCGATLPTQRLYRDEGEIVAAFKVLGHTFE